MRRDEILEWLRSHRDSVRGEPEQALDRAASDARRHAAEQAWRSAKQIAEQEMERWKSRRWGSHAGEDFVAREFCNDLADELRHLEPHPDESELIDADTLAAFDREARARLREWVREIAGEEEHRVWKEVVRFTNARARSLIREGVVSTAAGWEVTHSYAETAARLAAILAHDYEEHARPGA